MNVYARAIAFVLAVLLLVFCVALGGLGMLELFRANQPGQGLLFGLVMVLLTLCAGGLVRTVADVDSHATRSGDVPRRRSE